MDSITRHVVMLQDSFTLADDTIIPICTCGFVITEEYLKRSNFSPSDYEQLLSYACQAKSEGCLYVDFHTCGKRASIPQDLLL
jgi:hypothetical protein